jgi:hypothetical protein
MSQHEMPPVPEAAWEKELSRAYRNNYICRITLRDGSVVEGKVEDPRAVDEPKSSVFAVKLTLGSGEPRQDVVRSDIVAINIP